MERSIREERRIFTRIPIDNPVMLRCGDEQRVSRLLDISLKGALIAHPEGYAGTVGEPCSLILPLGSSDIVITMQGNITHNHEGHIGFQCSRIDLDSLSHLRRLLELHLGDESLLERELAELVAAGLST